MSAQASGNGSTRVSPLDRRSRPISTFVRDAAEAIGPRAIQHAERLFVDPAEATNILEEAAATVSRALRAKATDQNPIRNLESYLFRAFLRRLNKAKKREILISETLGSADSRVARDPSAALEMKIFLDEFMTHCDSELQDVLCRRMAGYSWAEIADLYGISRHAAESKFSQAIQRISRKLRLRQFGTK